ncbi:MAG: hypothetical protein K2P78_04160 [Gemmataceae bacterium]|nr:hypothetical protein [Gemmataceae bacterium]
MSQFSLNYQSKVTLTEVLAAATAPAASQSQSIRHDGFDTDQTWDGSTLTAAVPDVTGAAYARVSLAGGNATINLAALTHNGAAVDMTGYKVRTLKVKNPGSNPVTVVKGASNGYTGFGSAFSHTIPGGGELLISLGVGGVTVASGNRTLDLSGTGTDYFYVAITAGTP